jgi:hypothetical protein
VTDVSSKHAPPPPPAAPPAKEGIPASLTLGHPAALRPCFPMLVDPGRSNDELDRVVSMYYDRRPSDPAANKDWL